MLRAHGVTDKGRVRPSNEDCYGIDHQLSLCVIEDDSWAASVLARDPQMDPSALQNHPMRNALTNVVGSRAKTTVHVSEHPLTGGELLALTTDGVHGVLSDLSLTQMMVQRDSKR